MAILSDKDLFDFDGYFKRLVELDNVTEAWAQSLVASVDRIRSAFDGAQKEIAPLKAGLQGISITKDGSDRQITDYIQKISLLSAQANVARQSELGLTEAQKLNAQVITDLTTKLGSLKQRYDALDPTQKDYAKQQRALLNEIKLVSRAIDAQSKSLQVSTSVIDAAEGSITLLKKQTSELKKVLDGMPDAYDKGTGAINRQNKAALALNEQYQKNMTLLGKVEKGQQNFRSNVGNYPTPQTQSSGSMLTGSALSMAGRVEGAGLALAGVDSTLAAIVRRQMKVDKRS